MTRNPPLKGLRASFAAVEGVVIKMGPSGKPRKIIEVESNYVVTEGVESGHRSRIKRDNLTRYVVVERQ